MGSGRHWIVSGGTELLLSDGEQTLVSVPADAIWVSEQEAVYESLPPLSEIDLPCSGKPYGFRVSLVPIDGYSFGQLKLSAVGLRGNRLALQDSHQSDHVVFKGIWHALDKDAYAAYKALVDELGISLGEPLTSGQYISLLSGTRECEWFECTVYPTAKEVSEEVFRSYESTQGQRYFTGNLYDYQQRGSAWLSFMISQGVGVVLGDGMGLGKTIQVIKVVCDILQSNEEARILIVCPSALI